MSNLGRILIADDDETFLYSTADILRKKGYECYCALNGESAVELLSIAEYDLLIADINMPGNPGLELIQDSRLINSAMPAILVTGYPSIKTAIKSVQLPVLAYMVKPVHFDELLTNVKKAMESSRAYHAIRDTQDRLKNWLQDFSGTTDTVKKINGKSPFLNVETFLAYTLENIINAITDIKNLTVTLAGKDNKQYTCNLLNCPLTDKLIHTLKETTDVIEKTKNSFKSKSLGQLRKKLEKLLSDLESQS